MEDDSRAQSLVKWGLGALGLSAIVASITIHGVGLWIALGVILVLALLLFGGFYLWRKQGARRRREQFTSAIETQTEAAPRSISDPKKRADLDKVRSKFQTGLQEYKSRGKDLYALPWYVIIGESGSGKTEAIRHSEIDFPPGLNKEHQGTGGTVNMDWWFTNRGVILDTAGSMLFPEAGAGDAQEWPEFLRLLKKARPHCPINGLFLVLSIESLIKDSADKISQKASRLAQQLDLIQRTLDVRFPVYLLITKCDLLIGFREFFDNIEDPLLQHQIFGWSNPDPLDAPFRPDLVDQHLGSVAERVRRRRLALLRESGAGGRLGDTTHFFASNFQLGRGPAGVRRLDAVDSMFALPESVMRLAPRLRRYLETVFVAGEWSAKPVFLRGIYFTSSMREGRGLDEAVAFATGLSLDQLPEDRNWDKNRAFFLRDLFHEKVFKESGLVTRATNTLQLLRKRQLAIFGTAAFALLLFLVFALVARSSFKNSVDSEAKYWQAGARDLSNGVSIITPGTGSSDLFKYVSNETNLVNVGSDKLSLGEYHTKLKAKVQKPLSGGIIFAPLRLFNVGKVGDRQEAQRELFEDIILKPLVVQTRSKMVSRDAAPANTNALNWHREALRSLIRLEIERADVGPGRNYLSGPDTARKYLESFLSYLTDTQYKMSDSALVDVFAWTYSTQRTDTAQWPPGGLRLGDYLTNHPAIQKGLETLRKANETNELRLTDDVKKLENLVEWLARYQVAESNWLASSSCKVLLSDMVPIKKSVDDAWSEVEKGGKSSVALTSSLDARYKELERQAGGASESIFQDIKPNQMQKTPIPLIGEINQKLQNFTIEAKNKVRNSSQARSNLIALLDTNLLARLSKSPSSAYETRWTLYTQACAIASNPTKADETIIGDRWTYYASLKEMANGLGQELLNYRGPMADQVSSACNGIASNAVYELRNNYVSNYNAIARKKLDELASRTDWEIQAVTNAGSFLARVDLDLQSDTARNALGLQEAQLAETRRALAASEQVILTSIDRSLKRKLGFPLVLDSREMRTAEQLKEFKDLLTALTNILRDSVWAGTNCAGALKMLSSNCARYSSVVSSLVTEDGKGAHWNLFLVPPGLVSKEYSPIQIFPKAQVLIGSSVGSWHDISRFSTNTNIGEGNADKSVRLSFRKYGPEDPSRDDLVDYVNQANWGLVGMIKTCRPERFDDGLRWRFHFLLNDKTNHDDVILDAVLDKHPLPELKDWPMN